MEWCYHQRWETSCYHVDFLKFFTSRQYGHPLYSGRCQCLKDGNGVMLSPESGDTLWSPLSKPNAGVSWSSYFHLNLLSFSFFLFAFTRSSYFCLNFHSFPLLSHGATTVVNHFRVPIELFARLAWLWDFHRAQNWKGRQFMCMLVICMLIQCQTTEYKFSPLEMHQSFELGKCGNL